ncbi:hypothetical protein B0J13DRAFT_630896 [Dactylonectria estremocensis]|uniref:Uncharacterized protein n=1 Tax=Dactylonectria estremocensis TaxID=1079267 RepID=A0A9P9IC66_9HYPO|nr:hypothetical protein B0J13DRAFT_630896 [Dactylonectria estremocensis]
MEPYHSVTRGEDCEESPGIAEHESHGIGGRDTEAPRRPLHNPPNLGLPRLQLGREVEESPGEHAERVKEGVSAVERIIRPLSRKRLELAQRELEGELRIVTASPSTSTASSLRHIEQQRAEREQQRAEEAEEQTRPTTLDEYIAACHDLVFSKFAVETDKKLTSKGPITNPRNKWCPTHLRPWSDFLEQQRIIFGALLDETPDRTRDLNQLRPDQICVYRSNDALATTRTMIYVSEYKPPHKLTAPHLRLGLRAMNIPKDVVNRKTIPTSMDPDALFQYHADRLTPSAVTQTYHYMIEGGLEYGLLTTGEAIVFLRVDWEEPETLYHYLAEPSPEVAAHPNYFHVCTAVGQYLAFSLMALGPPGERRMHGQEDRRQATLNLSAWAEDFETTLRSIPESERRASDSSPGYEPITYKGVDRSPYPG